MLLDDKTGVSFYGESDGYYRLSFYPETFLHSQYGSVLQRALDIASVPSIREPPYTVRFGNGEVAALYLTDYHCIAFIYPYIAVSALLCIAVFLVPVLLYIGSRIRSIRPLSPFMPNISLIFLPGSRKPKGNCRSVPTAP